jgi:hypothetical protein
LAALPEIASNGAARTAPTAPTGLLLLSWPGPGGSAVIGAWPAGAPVIVSCAETGVAEKKAQIAAADRNMANDCFMSSSPMLNLRTMKLARGFQQTLEVHNVPCTMGGSPWRQAEPRLLRWMRIIAQSCRDGAETSYGAAISL